MLIAYLDEFGHQGPYFAHNHPRFNTHPCFGYAGYILPADKVRRMGGYFKFVKEKLLSWEIENSGVPSDRWEKKGSALLTTANINLYGDEILPALQRIFRELGKLDGQIFFYGQQKPIGTVKQTRETSQDRENHCLIQSIKRLGTYASNLDERLMVIMDATDTDNRERAVATLGATIYSKRYRENRSIIEVPLQTESHLYNTVQLADWICALLSRLSDYHFAEDSEFSWAVDIGRDIFAESSPTPNSIIWSNAPSKDSTCSPKQLVDTTRFWEVEQRRESQKDRRRLKNEGMFKSLIDAGSPEFKARLEEIRNSNAQ